MTDTTQKPVFVYYDADAAPDDLHPSGIVAGTTFESPSPAVARQFHPKARILRYADGGEYNHRKALAEIRALEKENAPAETDDTAVVEPVAKPSRSRSTTSSKSKTGSKPAASSRSTSSKRSGSSQTKAVSTKASESVVPEPVALSVPESVVKPVATDSTD